MTSRHRSIGEILVGRKTGQYGWRVPAGVPAEVLCHVCFERSANGQRPTRDCKNCCGTQMEPVPFSEVWGIE